MKKLNFWKKCTFFPAKKYTLQAAKNVLDGGLLV
jgi:hypothetical protein